LPSDIKTYVHRIGRTGRLEQGIALSFFDPDDDMPMAKELVNVCFYSFGKD
jgi:superfamily II DNA/RNA helicase